MNNKNLKPKTVNKKYFGIFSVPHTPHTKPLAKKLVPSLILLSLALSGILAPISVIKISNDSWSTYVGISSNKVLAVLESDTSGGDESGGKYGNDNNPPSDGGSGFSSPFSCFGVGASVIGCTVGNIIYYTIFVPANYIIYMSGWLFDIAIALTLSSEIINAPFAKNGWAVVRDLANMFFIFILLYIAIATILDIAGYNAKVLLARLIIVALLLNFSLFFTRVIIDSSNILGLAFYDRISAPTTYSSSGEKFEASSFVRGLSVTPKGISSGIVDYFDPQRLIGVTPSNSKEIADFIGDNPGKVIFIYLFSSIIIIATAWAFFSIAFLFITRTAILWFLMATAPLAFAAIILPKTRSLFGKWMDELISKSFCVAVFLFFLWLITAFVNQPFLEKYIKPQQNIGGNIATDFFTVTVLILLNFLIIFILIIVAKQQTQKMCGAVAGFSMNMVSSLGTKAAGLLAGGVVGAGLRNTLGAYAFKKSDEWNKAGYGAGGLRERLQLQAARKLSGAGYDVRATKLGGIAELGKATGQKGYAGWVKERTAKDVAFAKSFGPGKKADKFREQFSENVENMGIFQRMVTGRGVLSTTQQKKSAKEIDKLVKGGEKITREEIKLDDLREKVLSLSKDNPIKVEDNKGALKDFDNIESLRGAIEKGDVDLDTAERAIDDAVEQRFDGLRDKLDSAKGQLAKVKDWGSPEEKEAATINISRIQRLVDSEKEIRRLSERKERRTKEGLDKSEREALQKSSSSGGDKDKK